MIIREAVRADLPAIIALLADDILGKAREFATVDDAYEKACMQITYIPGLGRHGAQRSHVEAVRVHAARRGQGVGQQMMAWAIEQARARGCLMMQLTSDKARADAHRFYSRLGFVASHEGMKLVL
jgi:GNAT superfamily N-acetyltransferase